MYMSTRSSQVLSNIIVTVYVESAGLKRSAIARDAIIPPHFGKHPAVQRGHMNSKPRTSLQSFNCFLEKAVSEGIYEGPELVLPSDSDSLSETGEEPAGAGWSPTDATEQPCIRSPEFVRTGQDIKLSTGTGFETKIRVKALIDMPAREVRFPRSPRSRFERSWPGLDARMHLAWAIT
jgi:hypothetical protein